MFLHQTADTVIDFANREFQNLIDQKVPLPLLDARRGTICGIRVDPHNYIKDFATRAEIEAQLKKIKINAKYVVTPTPEFVKSKHVMIFTFNSFVIILT